MATDRQRVARSPAAMPARRTRPPPTRRPLPRRPHRPQAHQPRHRRGLRRARILCGGKADHGWRTRDGAERHLTEMTAAVAQQSVRSADPECTCGVFGKTGDVVTRKVRLVFAAEDGEVEAVKAREATLGCNPEIAIAGLQCLVDAVLRKAVLCGPRLMTKVQRRLCGGTRRAKRQEKAGENAAGAPGRHGSVCCAALSVSLRHAVVSVHRLRSSCGQEEVIRCMLRGSEGM